MHFEKPKLTKHQRRLARNRLRQERKERLQKQTRLYRSASTSADSKPKKNSQTSELIFLQVPILATMGAFYYFTGFIGFLVISLAMAAVVLSSMYRFLPSLPKRRQRQQLAQKNTEQIAPAAAQETPEKRVLESATAAPSGQPFGVPDI